MGLLFCESPSLDISCGDLPVKDEDCTLLSMAGGIASEGSIVGAPENKLYGTSYADRSVWVAPVVMVERYWTGIISRLYFDAHLAAQL